jgi:pre-mRNA-splicing factor 38B
MVPGVVPGVVPGMVPGVAPGVMPGVAPGVMPGVMPGVAPGVLPGAIPSAYIMQQVPPPPQMEEEEGNKVPMIENINTKNFNINPLIVERIYTSEFFRSLMEYKTYHEVIDGIYNDVWHMEPWELGQARNPSPCFCYILKFCTMRLTRRQLNGLLDHKQISEKGDNCFIRGIGFLYLRFTLPPKMLYDYYEPYFDDEDPIQPGGDKATATTIGKWIKSLLEGNKYFSTILPRIPVPVERKYKMDLLALEKAQEERLMRHKKNEKNRHLFTCKTKVVAHFHEDKKW